MYKKFFVAVFIFFNQHLTAQESTKIYVNPSLGVQWGFSKFENKESLPDYIKSANLVSGARYGLGILLNHKDKWNLELGFGGADMGLGISYEIESDSLGYGSGRRIRYTTVHKMYLQWLKPSKLIVIRKKRGAYLLKNAKKKRHYDYLAVFNLGFLGGLAYEYTPHFSFANTSNATNTSSLFGEITLYETQVDITRKHSMGFYFGLYSQFLNKGEKRLQLGIIYQQGIQKRVNLDWTTSIDGVVLSNFESFTRGSYLALNATYPIKFLTLGLKKSKKLK